MLETVGDVLTECFNKDAHLEALYDIRQYKLPAVARVHQVRVAFTGNTAAHVLTQCSPCIQVAKWCGTMWVPENKAEGTPARSKIDDTVHSVAIVIPAGIGAKMLKSLVDLFLWLTKPPMDPRIFTDYSIALAFLRERRQAYVKGDLPLKPNPRSAPPSTAESVAAAVAAALEAVAIEEAAAQAAVAAEKDATPANTASSSPGAAAEHFASNQPVEKKKKSPWAAVRRSLGLKSKKKKKAS